VEEEVATAELVDGSEVLAACLAAALVILLLETATGLETLLSLSNSEVELIR
jgi:hypothetical protein